MKDPLNGKQNVKKAVIFGSPCRKDDKCSLLDNVNLEKKDMSEGNHMKKTDAIGLCNKENMPKMESEGERHGPDGPVFPENNAGVAKKSADVLTVTPGRRKQATPRKRNVNEAERIIKAVEYCEKEIVPSKNGKTENLMKEVEQKSIKLNGGKPKKITKNARKQETPSKIEDSPNVSASNRKRKPSDPKKKRPPPKKVVASKAASAAKKCNKRNKAKSPTVSKKITALDLDCNHRSESGDVSKTPGGLNEEMSEKTQPAVSLKIICTPFSQNGVDNTPVKEETKIPPVCTSSKKKTTLKNKKVSSPKKASKETKPNKNKAVAKKTSTLGKRSRSSTLTKNKNDSKIVGVKATVKKGSHKKSPVKEHHNDMACEPLPAEEGILKKTRGRRKMKKSEEYVTAFMSESDNDIEPDFSEDEYLPSKDEDPYVREKQKEGKNKLRVSFSCFDEDDEKDLDENVEKLQYSFDSNNKSNKKKTGVKFVECKPATKVKTSPTVSPTKKVKSPHRNKKEKEKPSETEDGDSQNESGPDMPLLSPSKGRKTKQKKRRVRIRPEKTFLDDLDNYATAEEDMSMYSATEDEGDCLVRIRKKRKRYGEPYSVTGNWYIAQGYLLDISNLIEMFVKKDGWRFKDFANCWQQLKFSQVYRGRQNFKELLELSEEIAFLTKRFIMPPHSTKTRIGSLYALYGLYYKHPFRAFFKIRLLGEEYEQLVELIRPYQSNPENHDPAFIFRKLELDGAILHVASSLEMGIDFYNAEREAVDIKYESQRLANSSIVARTLLPELLDGDNEILKQYFNTKVNVAGDGKEAEKSLSFVKVSITEEVKEVVKKLKEETLSILRLNDPPTAKVVPSTESENNVPSIGARRAEIMAKAVKADTSSEYLKKKCFREPSKLWDKTSKQVSLRQGLSDENDSSMSNRDVQDFMKAPSKEILDKPLVPQRRSQRKVAHKYIKRHIEEENEQIIASEAIAKESLSDQWEEQEGESSVVDEKVENCKDPMSDELEILSRVPPVLPKPKRVRGPPRKRILSQAIKTNKVDHHLTGLQALKRKVSDEVLTEKRRKRRQLKKVEPDEESAADLSRIIVDLPLVKMEASANMVHNKEIEVVACLEVKPNENEKLNKQENLERTITLNIQLKGENIYKNQHFKILNRNWMAIQGNEKKLDRLKKKLISIILPEHVKHTVDEDKVDVEITVLETEDTEIVCDTDTTFEFKTDTSIIDSVSSTIHDKNQVKSDVHYSLADEENIPVTLKIEKPYYSPQSKSTSDVIKDLQGMWESDSNDNGIDSVDDETYEFHSFVTKSEDSWSANICNEENKLFQFSSIYVTKDYEEGGRSEDFHDDKHFIDLVSDVDDFEDESEPIILTPGIVGQRPGYSLNSNNIVPAENGLNLSHSTAATPMFTSASLVGSPLKLKDKAMPTPLYRRADQAIESHSPGPFNPASGSKRYITYNSPLVVPGGQTPNLVPVSTSLPLLKSQYPQKGSFLIEQPYTQLRSDSMRPPAPSNQLFTACGNSSSTPSHAVYSPPESGLGSRIIVSSQSITTVESQSPLLCVPASARFPGSVTITPHRLTQASKIPGISTPVTYAHNPTSVSAVGLRPNPDLSGVKLVQVKISDTHSVLIPENEIATSATIIPENKIATSDTQMNVSISKTGREGYAKFSSPSSLEEEIPSSVTRDNGNHSTEMDSVMTSGLPISNIHHQTPPTNSVPQTSLVGQDGGLKCESNSSWVSNDSKSSFSTTSSGKVCSFLFSPKFTKQSGIKTQTVQATGIPVGPKKLKVPFFFKHSLVPKKKSL